jgi:hypothetical protein
MRIEKNKNSTRREDAFFLFLPALFVPLVIARGLTALLLLNAGSPEAIHFDTGA